MEHENNYHIIDVIINKIYLYFQRSNSGGGPFFKPTYLFKNLKSSDYLNKICTQALSLRSNLAAKIHTYLI